jgi:hypothetical protein
VTKEEQLQWEARMGRPAAFAAFAGGLLLVVGTFLLLSIPKGQKGVEPNADFLLGLNDSPGSFYATAAIQVLVAVCMAGVFYYLFRATIARAPTIPRWFVYVIVIGPLMYAVAQPLLAVDQVDFAEKFATRDYSFPDAKPGSKEAKCPAIRGQLGDDCATELARKEISPGAVILNYLGRVGLAFLLVMVPLRARRAGLVSPFMSILGVIAGVLFIVPLLPGVPVFIQAFWLGAIGSLFLGNWPGGRGPAWETGEPDPWPTAAERRGLMTPPPDEPDGPEPAAPEPEAEPDPVPERPSSRKRKRKR